jgi:hypothetical protein
MATGMLPPGLKARIEMGTVTASGVWIPLILNCPATRQG